MTCGLLDLTSCVVRGLHLADDGVAPDVLRAELWQEAQRMPAAVQGRGALC